MNTREFARLLAKNINDKGNAVCAIARKSNNGGWCVVDKSADVIVPSAVCITPIYDCIRWSHSQEEYRVGKVDVFNAISRRSGASCTFYVGPCGIIQ